MATDGDQSYAVFTYQCGELNWVRNRASIGFSAGPNLFANHPLSRQPNVNDIACVNQTCSPWTNVVYRITVASSCEICSIILRLNYKSAVLWACSSVVLWACSSLADIYVGMAQEQDGDSNSEMAETQNSFFLQPGITRNVFHSK